MTKGSIVTFDVDIENVAEVFTILQHGYEVPIKGKTVCTVSWIGESSWKGNKRDVRMCIQVEEYGELMFPLIAWKEATEQEKCEGYFAEYEVLSSEIHKTE